MLHEQIHPTRAEAKRGMSLRVHHIPRRSLQNGMLIIIDRLRDMAHTMGTALQDP